MTENRIKKVVIVGGGTAGWMTAAALGRLIGNGFTDIELVESDAIGTVGVGEATIPQIQLFNTMLGFDENDFMRRTQATFKLGIEFVDWGKKGDRYLHPFGGYGQDMEGIHFHHFWLRGLQEGVNTSVDDYCLQVKAAEQGKFMRPQNIANSPLSTIHYAFQFDAGLYAQFLREYAEGQNVKRTEGKVVDVTQNAETGFIESVSLENGQTIVGDLFIDCSGFRGLLIEKTLGSGFTDWSEFLPVNRAVTQGSEKVKTSIPYTRATAKDAGWQWRIPLQHRTGNGYVYCGDFIDDDAAYASLQDGVEEPLIGHPKFLKFTTGHRNKFWNKNVVALGLAAGFMEPLESTSIHMVQSGISRLMAIFPDKSFNQADQDHYNARTLFEYEKVRDFLMLHYIASTREDTPFWRHIRSLSVPESLEKKIALYKENGRLWRHDNELFNETSWFAVLEGQNIRPQRFHPMANILSSQELKSRLQQLRAVVANSANVMPSHDDFVKEHCAAPRMSGL